MEDRMNPIIFVVVLLIGTTKMVRGSFKTLEEAQEMGKSLLSLGSSQREVEIEKREIS